MPIKRSNRVISADRPIHGASEDVLGRRDFAKQLANTVKEWSGSESLVIGLYGGWGSGKTSMKNLILREIEKGSGSLPVMEFNPWRFSGKSSIGETFFADLRNKLRPKDFNDIEAIRRAAKLNVWSKVISSLSIPVRVAGGLLAVQQPEIGAGIFSVGTGMDQAAKITKEGAELAKAEAEYETLSTEELKQTLAKSLENLEKPLLIIIDDIDRLSTNEILEVFQLVKANGDFPNIIYFLLCEQNVVTKALDKVSNERGVEFLEKIVQIGFHVPHPSQTAIAEIVYKTLVDCVRKARAYSRWDDERWTKLYYGILRNC